jgi:glucose/arabinose dehydrogenase
MVKNTIFILFLVLLSGCSGGASDGASAEGADPAAHASCDLVSSGSGPSGSTSLTTQPMVTGLNTPWEVAILPGGDWLVTERPGRLRLVQRGSLLPTPVMTVTTVQSGEGGLLGLALDPQFSRNSYIYVFYTNPSGANYFNRVQRYTISPDHATATPGPVLIDNIAWNSVHNGGRIKFGPDGNLYISTGEGADPTLPENAASLNGKILRITSSGAVPADNPQAGNPWYIKGLRNPEAFDWLDSSTLVIADNGPTGEYEGRTGGDKVLIAQKGDDLGWPTIWHCETQAGLVSPILTWMDAFPPGGVLVYKGNGIPGWNGNVLVASHGAEQLRRIVLGANDSVAAHEGYLMGSFLPSGPSLGRLRTVFQGPGGELYVTTSNCDSRGSCPDSQDGIYQIN